MAEWLINAKTGFKKRKNAHEETIHSSHTSSHIVLEDSAWQTALINTYIGLRVVNDDNTEWWHVDQE